MEMMAMSIDGKYEIILDAEIARQQAVLELKTQGSKLSGSLNGAMSIEFTDGVVDGVNLSWTMRGRAAAMYPEIYTWICTATVAGDNISGTMDVGEVVGRAPFHGVRAGKSDIHAKPALDWKDLGLPRYEPLSVEWVNALRVWIKERARGKNLPNLSTSSEFTNPPAHLIRDKSLDFAGFSVVHRDGEVEVFDVPNPDADFRFVYPYDPFALNLRMNTNQYVAWVKENGARYADQVKMIGDVNQIARHNATMAGTGNDIRDLCWAQITL
jgi:hypothetical protein